MQLLRYIEKRIIIQPRKKGMAETILTFSCRLLEYDNGQCSSCAGRYSVYKISGLVVEYKLKNAPE